MSNLNLDIVRVGNKTHTRFRMKWYEPVVFRNWGSQDLRVTIEPEGGDYPGPVLDKEDNGVITVGPRQSVSCSILSTYGGKHFTYTAEIGQSGQSDPIVIIER